MKRNLRRFLFYFLFLLSIVGTLVSIGLTVEGKGELVFVEKSPVEEEFIKQYAYISGEIKSPGVYEIEEKTKIIDLVNQAGGFTDNADLNYINEQLNLSKIVGNEEKVFIPSNKTILSTVPESSNLISINSATVAELDSLPGVGASTAEKIISSRPYEEVEDLLNVDGIGEATFEKLLPLISL